MRAGIDHAEAEVLLHLLTQARLTPPKELPEQRQERLLVNEFRKRDIGDYIPAAVIGAQKTKPAQVPQAIDRYTARVIASDLIAQLVRAYGQ